MESSFFAGGTVRILGVLYPVKVRRSSRCRVEIEEKMLIVYSPSGKNSETYKKVFSLWRRRMLKDYCSERIDGFCRKLPGHPSPPWIRVKDLVRSLAGYGKRAKTVFVSPALYGFSPKSIDYVLACRICELFYGKDQAAAYLELLLGNVSDFLAAYECATADYLMDVLPALSGDGPYGVPF